MLWAQPYLFNRSGLVFKPFQNPYADTFQKLAYFGTFHNNTARAKLMPYILKTYEIVLGKKHWILTEMLSPLCH